MSEFEYLRLVTVGQYLPTGSPLHRLDPRAKLIMALAFVTSAVVAPSIVGLLVLLGAVWIGLSVARIPPRYVLRPLLSALPFLILLALLQVFTIPANDQGTILWHWWKIIITLLDLRAAALTMLRFFVLMLGISLFSFCTSTRELTHGTEHLLRPLQRLRLPAHEIALMLSITLRFVPLLALEAEHIAKAQASRGADFGEGRRLRLLRRAARLLPLLVPLFVSTLRRSETLILAMESRGYVGGAGRSHLVQLRASAADLVAVAATLLLATVALVAGWTQVDSQIWRWIVM
jgi:energy-coupling factor transport system permease protein